MLNKFHKTTSECQQRTSGTQKSNPSLRKEITERQGGDKLQQSPMSNTSSPELLGSVKGTKRRPNQESAPLRTTQVPEPERLGPGKYRQPMAGHGWFPAEQPRAWAAWAERLHVRWAGADPVSAQCGWGPANTRKFYFFAASLPPSPQRDWTSEPKKKKKKLSSTVPFVSGRKPDTEETSKQKKL